jgi:hypothetical protein
MSAAPRVNGSITRGKTHSVALVAHASAPRPHNLPVIPPPQIHCEKNLVCDDRRVVKRGTLNLLAIGSVQIPLLPSMENTERVHCQICLSGSTGSRATTTHCITVPSQSSAPEPWITPTFAQPQRCNCWSVNSRLLLTACPITPANSACSDPVPQETCKRTTHLVSICPLTSFPAHFTKRPRNLQSLCRAAASDRSS